MNKKKRHKGKQDKRDVVRRAKVCNVNLCYQGSTQCNWVLDSLVLRVENHE